MLRGGSSGTGRVNEEGRKGEYGTSKPVKATFRRRRGKRENRGGDEPDQDIFMHIWKCHNETLCTTIIY
jgi:hypothetical protein